MFLKSIEIRGFKSFADKTELSFKKGVTAVVGPNGSGKSNISDAVRWVLGEQSVKTLRGGKMEDVIFAGTQFRKPLGLAQVSLTLDNSDGELPVEYSDVTISRRLYRNGDSEYLINNNSCRLKDIQELFMDTGIGKEGYSIIGQGKIDAILSGKPEERRALFEEAAGIVKYKSRKAESEKKLQNTEQNLVRINDILLGIEERIEPLRIDSEKASHFIELSSRQKELEISLIVKSIKELDKKIIEYDEKLNSSSKDRDKLVSEKDDLKRKLLLLKDEADKEEKLAHDKRNEYYNYQAMIQRLNSDIVVLEERIRNSISNLNKDKTELQELSDKKSRHDKDIEENHAELKLMKEKQDFYMKQISSLEKTINDEARQSEELQSKIGELRTASIEILRKIAQCNNDKTSIKRDVENFNNKIEELKNQKENYNNNISINSTTASMLKEQKEEINKSVEELKQNITENNRHKKKISDTINELEKAFRERNSLIVRSEANHAMLLNLEKDYEGYNKSVKNLMNHINSGRIPYAEGKSFVLGEVIEVEKKYETAIDIALGSSVSNIITDDEIIAKNLIQYLKKNSLGRATFLPLSIIHGKRLELNSYVTSMKGFIGIGSDVVKYDLRYDKAVKSVLGRTIICDDMDNALKIAKDTNHSYRIVTVDGEMINPGGSMNGGSIFKRQSNVIGRKREIKELEEKLLDLKEKQNDLEKKIKFNTEEYKRLDDNGLDMKDSIHGKTVEIARIEGKIISLDNDMKKLKDGMKTSEREIAIIQHQISEKTANIELSDNMTVKLHEDEKENKNDILRSETLSKELMLKVEEHKEEAGNLKVEKAQVDEVVSNKILNLEKLKKDISEVESKIQNVEADILKNGNIKQKSGESIVSKKHEIGKIEQNIDELKSEFEEYDKKKAEIKGKLNKINDDLEEMSLMISKSEEEINKIIQIKAKYDAEKNSHMSKLNDDMNMTLAEAEDTADFEIDVLKSKAEVSSLKAQISALGSVNLGAIEEYKEVSHKYEFMSGQRNDLEDAKKELVNVIDEMTSKMRKMFGENFKELREKFDETFKELFKGGRADLILGQGDELTANIEINVEPPGKKLQNINLMSGGEKVLSAIALLFAILKMKPTPFCILDEIEAALDDANVFRYAEFLKKFSTNIQFIVITHRKGTMEASDILYGVTMEEKGISKIVSVDLTA